MKEEHPYYEVETTIVPGKECQVDEGELSGEEGDIETGKSNVLTTMIFTCSDRRSCQV